MRPAFANKGPVARASTGRWPTLLYPNDEITRRSWTDSACHRLKHEGGPTVRAWLETLDLHSLSAEVREVHRRTAQYFRNHEHRMDYPRYVRNGWQIGSGPVESACKTVVGNRLKGGGMRWGQAGADAVCHLRGLYLSEDRCWDSFWNSPPLDPLPTKLTLTRRPVPNFTRRSQ